MTYYEASKSQSTTVRCAVRDYIFHLETIISAEAPSGTAALTMLDLKEAIREAEALLTQLYVNSEGVLIK
jgi:hypothetical protein